jgi:hypothetical protein
MPCRRVAIGCRLPTRHGCTRWRSSSAHCELKDALISKTHIGLEGQSGRLALLLLSGAIHTIQYALGRQKKQFSTRFTMKFARSDRIDPPSRQ